MKRLYCLLLVVILLVGCASVPRTEANKRLVEFPEEIPGVSTVVKIEVKEAKHCLVHIGQQHWTSGMEDLALLEVMETQDEIYTILLYLRENILLREVYQEGNKEDVDNSRNLEEEHNIHVDFLLAKLSEMVEPDVLEGVKNDLKKNDEEYKEYCQNNALGRLKKEGKMVLKPAERTLECYNNALFFTDLILLPLLDFSEENIEEFFKYGDLIINDREDVLLDIISSEEEDFSVVVYGAAHNFYDNIKRWNQEDSDHKFSHIIVIPRSLENLSSRLYGRKLKKVEYYYEK